MSDIVEKLKERGFIDQTTSNDFSKILNDPVGVYVGFDPTSDSLHLGNLVGIIALCWFQRYGHTPYVILGGATGRVGDPSGKSIERPLLKDETIAQNVSQIEKFFRKVLDFSGKYPSPIILNNNDWYSSFSIIDFLRDVGKHFRMGPMLSKESVKSRLNSEEGMSFTEFSYQVLQGYDFYHLFKEHGVCCQMGGSDQWGNIVAGIEFTRKLTQKPVHGLTFPLLTKSDGKKFGKTEEGAIWLDGDKLSPYQFYQHLFRVSDQDVIQLLRMLTFLEIDEIKSIEAKMTNTPNIAQKRLAEELTRFVHGSNGLQDALRVTTAAAPGAKTNLDAQTLEEMPNLAFTSSDILGKKCTEIAVLIKLAASKSEMNRLIKNGGAYLNNEKIQDVDLVLQEKHLIDGHFILFGMGKKKKILIKIVGKNKNNLYENQ